MKQLKLIIMTAILALLPVTAMAGVQSSSNYKINGGSIVNGGGTAADVSGLSTTGSAIGHGVYIPPGGVSSSNYKVQVGGGGTLTQLPTGDANGDGKVDIADALRILQIAVGFITPTATDLENGDVAPLVNGRPTSNRKGAITVGDAVVVLQRTLGIVNW